MHGVHVYFSSYKMRRKTKLSGEVTSKIVLLEAGPKKCHLVAEKLKNASFTREIVL